MVYSSSTDVLTGRTVRLMPAPITLERWRTTLPPEVLDPAHPDSPLHCYHEARGYRFAWGQVLERCVAPAAECPTGLLLWDFVLEDAQRQYQAGGGNLEELADMALVFLDAYMPQHAPPWLHYDDGTVPAGFAFLVEFPHVPAARQWLRTFLTHGIPRLLAYVLDVNTTARHEDTPASEG